MSELQQVQPQAMYSGSKPVRDRSYRKFIRALPCVACLKTWWIEACHTGPHGTSQKACDRSCIPLCRTCHQRFDADPQGFATRRKLNIPALVAMFNSFYQTKLGGAA